MWLSGTPSQCLESWQPSCDYKTEDLIRGQHVEDGEVEKKIAWVLDGLEIAAEPTPVTT